MRYRKPRNYKEKFLEYSKDTIVLSESVEKGKWKDLFENENPIYLEIGMGKGKFLIEHAKRNPNINYIGIEKIEPLILGAAETIRVLGLKNIKLLSINANFLEDYFEDSEVSKIYLNFSDPWPKKRNANRRLTHENMISRYKKVLKAGSNVEFKTDNLPLFEFSVCEFSKENTIEEIQIDLHSKEFEIDDERIIKTEYEGKFVEMGKKIYRLSSIIKK